MMTYEFINEGSHGFEPVAGKLFLDVGNRIEPGIIDHHIIEEQSSTSKIVFENPEFVTRWIPQGTKDYIIVLHKEPGLDCILSTYIAKKFINKETLPPHFKLLIDYSVQIDQGYIKKPDLNNPRIYEILEIIRNNCKSDSERIEKGLHLIDYVNNKITEEPERNNLDGLFKDKHPYLEEVAELKIDKFRYEADLKDPQKTIPLSVYLPHKKTRKPVLVDGLLYRNPNARHFKLWSRTDTSNSTNKRGFILLMVIWSQNRGEKKDKCRYVISVDPNDIVDLEELGYILNYYEEKALEEKKIRIEGKPRFREYNLYDPWYDGRGHKYTIIDTPNRGTELSEEDIKLYLYSFMDLFFFYKKILAPVTFCQLFFHISIDKCTSNYLKHVEELLLKRSWIRLEQDTSHLGSAFKQFLFCEKLKNKHLIILEKKISSYSQNMYNIGRLILSIYTQGSAILSLDISFDLSSIKDLFLWKSRIKSGSNLHDIMNMLDISRFTDLDCIDIFNEKLENSLLIYQYWNVRFINAHVSRNESFYKNLLAAFVSGLESPTILIQSDLEIITKSMYLGKFGRLVVQPQGTFLFLNNVDTEMPKKKQELVVNQFRNSCWFVILNALLQKGIMDMLIAELAKKSGEDFDSRKLHKTLQDLRERSIHLATRSINYNLTTTSLANNLWKNLSKTLKLYELRTNLKDSIDDLANYVITKRQARLDKIILFASIAIGPLTIIGDYFGAIIFKGTGEEIGAFFPILGITYGLAILAFGITYFFLRLWKK